MPDYNKEDGIFIDRSNHTHHHEAATGASSKRALEVFTRICAEAKNEGGVDVEEAKRLVSIFCQLNESLGKESRETHKQIHENKQKEHERELEMFKARVEVIEKAAEKVVTTMVTLKMKKQPSIAKAKPGKNMGAAAK